MSGPDPMAPAPLPGHPRVFFLKPLALGRPNVEAGDYAYADDPEGPEGWFDRAVLHHHPEMGDRLVIGRFAALAHGVRFVMNGATHATGGFSTFPFSIFGHGWEAGFDPADWDAENRGDTVVGPDVWIGTDAMILPGTRIGAGAIIGARAVVAGEIPPYAVAAGNPARVVRMRFPAEVVARLLALAWWDWPAERIVRALAALRGRDLAALEAAAP